MRFFFFFFNISQLFVFSRFNCSCRRIEIRRRRIKRFVCVFVRVRGFRWSMVRIFAILFFVIMKFVISQYRINRI